MLVNTEKNVLLRIEALIVKKHQRSILDGLKLNIAAGEVHALLGANGTGKSTLAYAIMGCQDAQPSNGDILLEERSLLPLSVTERAKMGIALAWQEPVRFEGLSVAQYLTLGRTQRHPGEALEMVGLSPGHYLKRMVDTTLSGGERKRIELASLLSLPLRLAILDEPDSGIDMLSTQDIINVINAFRNDGTSVLLITHRKEIARIADRASQVCGGKIIRTGPPREVADQYLGHTCSACNKMEYHNANS